MSKKETMKITDLRVQLISAELDRPYWMSREPYRTSSEIVVELETNTGEVGIGEVHGRPLEQIGTILADVFAPTLRGRKALEVFPSKQRDPLWEELYLNRPDVVDGEFILPDGPGFGIE